MYIIYGIINKDNSLIDVSNTLLGAKQYATRNEYKKVGYRVGYNVIETWTKDKKKWVKDEN
tara:strand:+ start:3199 stop:3381 length:183 start_codon:yes stop_codon:yes gene_type:complete